MIGYLSGKVISLNERSFLLNVNGVGYRIFANNSLLGKVKVGTDFKIWTHLIVKEDLLDLYGFETEQEIDFFKLLLKVSGVGPKSALGVLNVASIGILQSAISSGDVSYLKKVSGIGPKAAGKIILELKDKMGDIETPLEESDIHENLDVIEALRTLGFSEQESRDALKHIPKNIEGTSKKVAVALKYLGE